MAEGNSRWLPGFVACSAIWGSSFVLIKIAVNAGVAPAWVAAFRCLFGAIALGCVCLATRATLPRERSVWLHALVVAALINTGPFILFAYGETRVSSVLAGMWNATTPLTTLVFVLALVPAERPNAQRLAGLATGFCGVLVILRVWHGVDSGTLAGSLACLGATTGYGAGFAYTRRFFSPGAGSAAALSLVQIGCATVELAILAPAFSGAPSWPGFGAIAALIGLGALGTGIAFVLNMQVIRAAGPTIASTVTYLTPLWSTLLGALLLSEHVGWYTVTGGILIIGGVVLARVRFSKRATSRQAPTSPA